MEESAILSFSSSVIKEEEEASPLSLISPLVIKEEEAALDDQGNRGRGFGHGPATLGKHQGHL